MSQYDQKFDLKTNLGQCPILYSPMILPFILKNISCITPYFQVILKYLPNFDLKINVGHSDCYFTVW